LHIKHVSQFSKVGKTTKRLQILFIVLAARASQQTDVDGLEDLIQASF